MKNFRKIANGPIRYHVDKANRVVVATMYSTKDITLNFLFNTHYGQRKGGVTVAPFPNFGDGIECQCDLGYLEMNDSYTARAFCHPDDTFDAEVGIKVAEEKLFRNVYKAFINRLKQYEAQLERASNGLKEQIHQLDENNE